MTARFQGDAQWQRDFSRYQRLLRQNIEHAAAGRQLLASGAADEARAELELSREAREWAELLEYELRLVLNRPERCGLIQACPDFPLGGRRRRVGATIARWANTRATSKIP